MKRFRRWLFDVLTGFSLLLLVVASLVWMFDPGDLMRLIDTDTRIYYVGLSKTHVAIGIGYNLEKWSQPVWSFAPPCWLVIIMAGILPVMWMRGLVRRRRFVPPGMCRVCGYDLRATPDRCPECGTIVTRSQ